MKDYECIITCPKCGTVLFKSKSVGSIEAKCPKCNMHYRIEQSGNEIKVREAAVHYRAGSR